MHVNDMVPNSMELIEENRRLRHMIGSLKEDLRDQFAIHCPISLTDFIQCKGWEYECGPLELQQFAELRYRYADAMMKAREGREG